MSAREANELLNAYVADRSRSRAVWHDHFVGEHDGGVVLDTRDDEEEARLEDPGLLLGSLEQYRDELAADEPDDPRYWWRRSA